MNIYTHTHANTHFQHNHDGVCRLYSLSFPSWFGWTIYSLYPFLLQGKYTSHNPDMICLSRTPTHTDKQQYRIFVRPRTRTILMSGCAKTIFGDDARRWTRERARSLKRLCGWCLGLADKLYIPNDPRRSFEPLSSRTHAVYTHTHWAAPIAPSSRSSSSNPRNRTRNPDEETHSTRICT